MTLSLPSTTHRLIRSIAHRRSVEPFDLEDEGSLATFERATGWLNSDPLTAEGLRGRVVLVDFWTYICINWIRTLPNVRAWAAKCTDLHKTGEDAVQGIGISIRKGGSCSAVTAFVVQ